MEAVMRVVGVGLLCLLFVACSHGKAQKVEPGSYAAASQTSQQPAGIAVVEETKTAVVPACSVDDNCSERQLCIRSVCTDIAGEMAECAATRVYFDTDSIELGPTARAMLGRVARCLRADQKIVVTIAGNTDSTGTKEYNRDLGDRRASAVADYLIRQGASPEQLRTLSFADELPLCWSQDADCMARNRRATVKPQPQRDQAKTAAPRKM
jgi:outer membrane protein OmpA-like peptidoglycan-associated protein